MTGRFGNTHRRSSWGLLPGRKMKLQVFTAADKICATFQGDALLTLGHKFDKNLKTALAFCSFSAILKANGLGTPVYEAAVAPVMGGDSLKTFFDDSFFESVGRCFCTGVTSYTCSNPAGSFFVPDLELRGKSKKTLYEGGSSWKTLKFSSDFTSTISPSTTDVPTVFPVRWRPG